MKSSLRVAPPNVVNMADLRRAAQRRLPKEVFEYVDGGAESEITLQENYRAFDSVSFLPRNAVAVGKCQVAIRLLGCDLSFPLLLAPCGFSRMLHPQGEVGAARAAGKAGIPYILSTMSGYRLEDVAAASTGPVWYQLYLVGGRSVAEVALDRARRAGFSVLAITVDTGAPGMRERDVRNGASVLMGGSKAAMLPCPAAADFAPRMAIGISARRRAARASQHRGAR